MENEKQATVEANPAVDLQIEAIRSLISGKSAFWSAVAIAVLVYAGQHLSDFLQLDNGAGVLIMFVLYFSTAVTLYATSKNRMASNEKLSFELKIAELEGLLEGRDSDVAFLEEKYEALENENIALNTHIGSLELDKQAFIQRAELLQSENSSLADENEALKIEKDKLLGAAKATGMMMKALDDEVVSLKEENEALKAKVTSEVNRYNGLSRAFKALKEKEEPATTN